MWECGLDEAHCDRGKEQREVREGEVKRGDAGRGDEGVGKEGGRERVKRKGERKTIRGEWRGGKGGEDRKISEKKNEVTEEGRL
jgi:hypothetical protein